MVYRSALMGILYDVSIIGVVIFCVGLQLAAVPIFLKVRIWLAQNLQWHEISSAISRNLCQLLFRDRMSHLRWKATANVTGLALVVKSDC